MKLTSYRSTCTASSVSRIFERGGGGGRARKFEKCNYIFFTKLPWPGDSEGTFRSSSQAATCPSVYHTRWRLHTVPLIAERQAGSCEYQFFSLWFDSTGNRTRVYRFSSRRSIHSRITNTRMKIFQPKTKSVFLLKIR